MSPKTTPSAAKLKPAAPIAETGLTFSAEILVTRISNGSRQSPAQRLSLRLVRIVGDKSHALCLSVGSRGTEIQTRSDSDLDDAI
jgi:hypothetical protein